MNERIIIEDFVGIKLIDLITNDFTVLIGQQATGKSICAKLLYFFKSYFSDLEIVIENYETKRDLDHRLISKFMQYFPDQSWGDSGFRIKYEIDGSYIVIEKGGFKNSKLKVDYSESFKDLLPKCRKIHRSITGIKSGEEEFYRDDASWKAKENIISYINKNISNVTTYNQIFVPAGRSFFANLQSSIFSFLSSNKALDPFLVEFGSFYERVKTYHLGGRRKRNKQQKELIDRIDELTKKILLGTYHREKGKDYLILHDGRKINVSNASSGQQEMLPLAILLSFIPFPKYIGGGATVYIEEPEAHLFPTAQKHIIELIATVYNSSNTKLQFVITTHSPYILTSINNLLQAGIIKNNLREDMFPELFEIVPESHILQPSLISPYSLKNGSNELLTCRETGLISTNIIDDVSNELAIQFDNLLEM